MSRQSLSKLVAVVAVVAAGAAVATTDAVSMDGDAKPAPYEYRCGSDPLSPDTDGDGLDDATAAFANAAVDNPDGTTGITLHVTGERRRVDATEQDVVAAQDPADHETIEPYTESREKAHGFSRGMNPVSLLGIRSEIRDTGSEASPPKPLSRSGAVLARPEPRHPTGELPPWGCPSVTGPRPSVAVEPHDFSRGRSQKRQFLNEESMRTESYAYTLVVVGGEGAAGARGWGGNAIALLSDPATYPGRYEGPFVHELLHAMTTGVTKDDPSCDVYDTNHACEGYPATATTCSSRMRR